MHLYVLVIYTHAYMHICMYVRMYARAIHVRMHTIIQIDELYAEAREEYLRDPNAWMSAHTTDDGDEKEERAKVFKKVKALQW